VGKDSRLQLLSGTQLQASCLLSHFHSSPFVPPPILFCFSNVAVFEVGMLISEWLRCTSHCEIPPYWSSTFYSYRNVFNEIDTAVEYY